MPAKPPQSQGRTPLATPKEVAAFLQKPEGTLREWRHKGIGPDYIPVGRDVRYDWADVDAWLKEQKHQGAA